jgi:hypothetical protein
MKHILLLSVISSFSVIAQGQTALVKGAIQNKENYAPLAEMDVIIPSLKLMKVTDAEGRFTFSQVPYGTHQMVISTSAFKKDTVMISVDQAVVDLGVYHFEIDRDAVGVGTGQTATIALEDNFAESDEDGISGQNISGVLTASRDPYLSAASFTFGALRYQIRGYKRDQLEVYMNGLPMNDAESGSAFFGQWGGLNDAFRNQTTTFGLNPSEVGFGGLTGATQIDATAADQRKQTVVSYAASNRTYRNRLMVTHNSGTNAKGWAYSLAGSKRWANEGYIPGTFYDGYSYYAAISKRINSASSIHLTTFGAPTSRGKAMPATQEAMDIAGSNFYNPNWGYINGEKKNARVNSSFQPAAILSFKHNPDENTRWNSAIGFQSGYNGNTALDWYNAMDPRPDYYRNLPSYYLYDPKGADVDAAQAQLEYLQNNPDAMQINWQRLYDANRMNRQTVNGETGNRSVYVIGEDRDDINKFLLSSIYQKVLNPHVKYTAGIAGIYQKMESYRKLADLLGGDYYVNLNQFAERTYIGNNDLNQNDLNNPNGIIKKGDKYAYHYKSDFYRAYAWAQGEFTYNKVDFFLTGRLTSEGFQRNGIFKSGIFAQDSEGKSERFDFLTYAVKGGATYKIDGRNYLYASGNLMTAAPTFDNTFVSPRTRNKTIDNPKLEQYATIEGGYLLRAPNVSGRLSGFVTESKDLTDIKRFYHEDYRTFVNYAMRNINIRNLGVEMAVKAKLTNSLSLTAVAAWTQVFYTNRPEVSVFMDNDTSTKVSNSLVYLKNYYVASGPQSAYTVGLNYNSPQYWFANINFNYFDRNYLEVSPASKTAEALDGVERNSALWNSILTQEKLPTFFTVDIFAGKSFRLNKIAKSAPYGSLLRINVGVNNLLNNREIITGGFEQLRFDTQMKNPDRFPSKYFYGYGANYFINLALVF